MTIDGARLSNEKLAWFFTDPSSRYELAEVIHLTQCSRDDIQNWVRRGMIVPDETTPGRRIYLPTTVVTLAIASILREQGESANYSIMNAHVITDAALDWFADGNREEDEMPKFEKDFRQHFAVYLRHEDLVSPPSVPSKPGNVLLPGILHVAILHRSEVDSWLDCPVVRVIRLHWLWLNLAEFAKILKDRPTRRLPKADT